jgi:pantoate kinase
MMNSCGGFVVGTISGLTDPGAVRQVNGVGVAGMGVWVKVGTVVAVAVCEGADWACAVSFDGKQAESPVRSERQVAMRMA